ncbi:2-oxoglutarate and iron-dependent oxygenase domain-containing protein 3-like protein [Leptotrombidium deliense]|uniref:2-oxoglutarate and iron-dependent oxygenase domain-containing protein 3-like protein n=1 Tax=Leptotrombidium deliense TaxID=299467 RepID=A0A443SD51_9ACAR|nr:2-oxoglutarate and iron-dependent oxygenase domain-containing protein 3-like protein [Leptotrombidium deliense]
MFSQCDYNLVKKISELVKHTISITFGLPAEKLYFTNVTQFTRHRPLTKFSEFRHVDKLRSPSLVVTSIVWLSTVDVDFYGGRTEFLTGGPEPYSPLLIDPKIGRFAAWTSSYENPHGVHEIIAGDRYSLIFTFTVNKRFGHETIDDLKRWSLDPANIPKNSGRRTLTFVKAYEPEY